MTKKKSDSSKVKKVDGKSQDIWNEKLRKLQSEFPEILSDNQLNCEKFKKLVGEENVAEGERYQFTWAGKSEAFKEIKKRTTATLKPDREESVNFDNTENIFIEGENLEVLKILQKSYYGKIKMIYIDPPYNTGNDFIYNDQFAENRGDYEEKTGDVNEDGKKIRAFQKNTKESGHYHSNWLSMMYPRLYLARNLLREDGVIFISIDDNEVYNLRMIMNEIFGEENFVAQLVWRGRSGAEDDDKYRRVHEYVLVYSKHEDFEAGMEEKKDENFPKLDKEKGRKYKTQLLRKWGDNSRRIDRPNLYYPIKRPDGEDFYPTLPNGKEGCWRWSKSRMKKEIEAGNIEFSTNQKGETEAYEKIYEPKEGEVRYKKFNTWLENGRASTGTKECKELFDGKKIFDRPKPTILIKKLLSMGKFGREDLVLDFFAGSTTTAHAVLDLNTEDGGSRKYIMVQLPEETKKESEAKKAGYETIAAIGKERIRRVIKQIKEKKSSKLSLDKENIDLGFKVFKLSDSNFKSWRQKEIENKKKLQKKLENIVENVKERDKKEDILFELIFKLGVNPNAKIKVKDNYYILRNSNKYIICLAEKIEEALIKNILDEKPDVIVCLDIGFKGDDELKTNTALQMKSKGIEFKVV